MISRHSVRIRDADPQDVDALLGLWDEAGREAGRPAGQSPTPRPRSEAAAALAELAANPDSRLLVAELEGAVVAAVHLRRAPISPLHTEDVVQTSYLMVRPAFRGHGIARLLLEEAVHWAEEKDIAHVSAMATSSSRDANRFLARLGLATVASVRVTTTASLRTKLTPERVATTGGHRSLGHVLAQRRTMRRREAGGS